MLKIVENGKTRYERQIGTHVPDNAIVLEEVHTACDNRFYVTSSGPKHGIEKDKRWHSENIPVITTATSGGTRYMTHMFITKLDLPEPTIDPKGEPVWKIHELRAAMKRQMRNEVADASATIKVATASDGDTAEHWIDLFTASMLLLSDPNDKYAGDMLHADAKSRKISTKDMALWVIENYKSYQLRLSRVRAYGNEARNSLNECDSIAKLIEAYIKAAITLTQNIYTITGE